MSDPTPAAGVTSGETGRVDDDDPMAVRDMGFRKTMVRTFYAYGLADAMRSAADFVIEHGQFGVWDVATDHDVDTGYWYVNVYVAMFVERDDR